MANPVDSQSEATATPAVKGEHRSGGDALVGISNAGTGVHGKSSTGRGVVAESETNFGVRAVSVRAAGVRGSSIEGRGVEGQSTNSDGVVGNSEGNGAGVIGLSNRGIGVHGKSSSGRGVVAESETDFGLRAHSVKAAGMRGSSVDGRGVEGQSTNSDGVVGNSEGAGAGVIGISKNGIGIHARGGRLAGLFEGDVEVRGDLTCPNADCAEDFDVAGSALMDPGTVMVLNEAGEVEASYRAYDGRVAGVVSGGGTYRPGIVLDRRDTNALIRQPVALLGKVFCKVDAQFGPIEIGDLLTTSATPGHAMKATNTAQAFGAVIGKALRPLSDGQGLIPILVALQ